MSETNTTLFTGEGTDSRKGASELEQLVVFTLDDEEYAVPITDLQEIIKVPEITPIPNAPIFIKGILNLRGKIVVVIDLEKRFQLVRDGERDLKHIIITEVNDTSFGVVVDEVIEVLTVQKSVIQPTPALVSSKIHTDYLKGVVVLKSDMKNLDEKDCDPDTEDGATDFSTSTEGASNSNKVTARSKNGQHNTDGSRLLILIDLSKILHEKELLEVSETAEEASALGKKINN